MKRLSLFTAVIFILMSYSLLFTFCAGAKDLVGEETSSSSTSETRTSNEAQELTPSGMKSTTSTTSEAASVSTTTEKTTTAYERTREERTREERTREDHTRNAPSTTGSAGTEPGESAKDPSSPDTSDADTSSAVAEVTDENGNTVTSASSGETTKPGPTETRAYDRTTYKSKETPYEGYMPTFTTVPISEELAEEEINTDDVNITYDILAEEDTTDDYYGYSETETTEAPTENNEGKRSNAVYIALFCAVGVLLLISAATFIVYKKSLKK